jgi:hypothetical protein
MPVLKHKTPCIECPWKRQSLAGWLGPQNADWYVDRIRAEQPMACHMHFDDKTHLKPENEAISDLPYCAGSLIVQRNMCKKPRDLEYATAVERVERTLAVFSHPFEFWKHHTKEGLDPNEIY